MMNIIHDIEPIYEVEKYDVVLVGVTIYNHMSNGFHMKIGNKYPHVYDELKKTNYADTRKYGKILVVEGSPTVCLMFTYGYRRKNVVCLNYEALETALLKANEEFKGKKVLATNLGYGRFDGNGDKDECLEIIERCTKDLQLDLYDYPQFTRDEEYCYVMKNIYKMKKSDPEEYERQMSRRFQIITEKYIRRIKDEVKAPKVGKRQRRKQERTSNK